MSPAMKAQGLFKFDHYRREESRRNEEWSHAWEDGKLVPFTSSATWLVSLPGKKQASIDIDAGWLTSFHQAYSLMRDYYANPLTSVNVSKTMLLPHQVEAAVRVVDSIEPRFLIADEVGLGKTIEAGLVIKELILKYSFDNVLIVVPSPLLYQWQNEMLSKFNEKFDVVTGDTLRRKPEEFLRMNRVLVSVDLAKDERYESLFLQRKWDIAVFDEAHRLRRDGSKVTRAWKFAEVISRHSQAFVLLSATPFRGKLEELYYLIQLLDPDILGPLHSFMNDFNSGVLELQRKLAPVVIRRRKKDVGGFTRRYARTVKLTLTSPERVFYDEVTEYVRREYNRAVDAGQSLRGFVMITFQKLLDSSAEALLRALRRRRERLEQKYFAPVMNVQKSVSSWLSDLDEETKSEIEQDAEDWFDDAKEIGFDPMEARAEIMSLTRLIELGLKIEEEQKFLVLIKTIQDFRKKGHEKFLIFTQFRSTLEFLEQELKKEYRVRTFHGAMTAMEKEKAIADFYEDTEILILTEAGGEGRNLQVAGVLINYDLPWSPLKIEQRIGRIHRFGQKRDVHVVNFATRDTVAERVLEVLENKIQLFEDAFGESDTLLGVLEDEFNFSKNFEVFMNGRAGKKELEAEIQNSFRLARENIGRIDKLLSPEIMNFDLKAFRNAGGSALKKINEKNEKTLKKLADKYFRSAGFELENADNLTTIKTKDRVYEGSFFHSVVEERNDYDYFALGHPLVDEALYSILSKTQNYPIVSADCRYDAVLAIQVRYRIDRDYIRYYMIGRDDSGTWQDIHPDLRNNSAAGSEFPVVDIAGIVRDALQFLSPRLEEELGKLRERVVSSAQLLRRNIESAHETRNRELDDKLMLQKGKAHWYGADKMASAITRTVHQQQKENLNHSSRLVRLKEKLEDRVMIHIEHVCLNKNAGSL